MIVQMNADGVVVRDADDCGRLHLETTLDAPALATALRVTDSGEQVESGDVWLDLAVLRSRAQLAATGPDWAEQWSAMVAYAEGKGWVSEDGRSVRVHVEAA